MSRKATIQSELKGKHTWLRSWVYSKKITTVSKLTVSRQNIPTSPLFTLEVISRPIRSKMPGAMPHGQSGWQSQKCCCQGLAQKSIIEFKTTLVGCVLSHYCTSNDIRFYDTRYMKQGCISDHDGLRPDCFELLVQLPKHLIEHFVHPPISIRDSSWP